LFARLASLIGLGSRPTSVTWSQIFGASWLCGIGFTMSLFIASLALGDGDLLDMAKIGTLASIHRVACCASEPDSMESR
jgi:NhaA family Na+:H+ antiporter